jgi:hypothetical protein
MLKRTLRASDWTAAALGHVARTWYGGWAPQTGQELQRELISPSLIQAIRHIDEAAAALAQICKEGERTANELAHKSSQIKSPRLMTIQDREIITGLGRKLAELDLLIERLGNAHEAMTPFARMSIVLMHNLPGIELAEIGKQAPPLTRKF